MADPWMDVAIFFPLRIILYSYAQGKGHLEEKHPRSVQRDHPPQSPVRQD